MLGIYDFIHRGYLPKELPPAFNAYHLAVKYDDVQNEWNIIRSNVDSRLPQNAEETEEDYKKRKNYYKTPVSIPVVYSISKGKVCRRDLAVINPVNFLQLITHIDTNIAKIKSLTSNSPFTQSAPTYNTNIHSRCYRASSGSVMALIKKKLQCAIDKQVEVKVDINNFYPSIYTHSITWAMVGKGRAKELWRQHGNSIIKNPANDEERMYNIGYKLDAYIEHCQDKQTSGIPIGPDSSFIVAELVTAFVDRKIHTQFPNIKGCRYYDDYTFYVSNREEADSLVRYIQEILNELELSVNERKIEIKEAPQPVLDDFAEELSTFDFEASKTEKVLICYFNLLWKLCALHPNRLSTIIRYGLRPLETSRLNIGPQIKDLFESLLYKTAMLDPSSLDLIQQLFTIKNITPTNMPLNDLMGAILDYHAPLSHHHEVSWVLWFCKKYNLTLDKERVLRIFKMNNPICTLMLLDYINNNPSVTALKADMDVVNHIQQIESQATPEDLFGDNWILLYEGAFHGWLKTKAAVNGNPYFEILLSDGISFYDINNNADYQSYDYIETLPYNHIPNEMIRNARDMRQSVFRNVYAELNDSFESDEDLTKEDIEDAKESCKEVIKDHKMEKDIYEKILSELFRREAPDLQGYIDKVIENVKELLLY